MSIEGATAGEAVRAAGRGGGIRRDPLNVSVQIATRRAGVPHARSFARWANAAFEAARGPVRRGRPWELTIRVVGAAESRRLNRTWRGKDKPTNVLSFFSGAESPDGRALGDLVICAPVVAREAREQGKSIRAHWAHMVVHGVLHLTGYDHENERDAAVMEACESKILAQFAIPDPYG